MNKTNTLFTFVTIFLIVIPASGQKRDSRRQGKQSSRTVISRKINQSATRPRKAQPAKLLPLVPEYEYDQYSGTSRVDLKGSPVEEQSGASDVRLFVRYVYAKDWMQIGTQNDVLVAFSINVQKRVCTDDCMYTLILDGYEQPVRAASSVTQMGDGTINEFISKWMSPKVFKKITEAQTIQVKVGGVRFRLSDRQIDGMRQIVSFLRFRPFFN